MFIFVFFLLVVVGSILLYIVFMKTKEPFITLSNTVKKNIPIGPFIIHGWKFFPMNPSIDFNRDNGIQCIARLDNNVECFKLTNLSFIDISELSSSKLKNKMEILQKHKDGNHMLNLIVSFEIGHEKHMKLFDNLNNETFLDNHNGHEDPRYFSYLNNRWVYANSRVSGDWEGRTIIFPESDPNDITTLFYDKANKVEKNWMPFQHHNSLMFEYSLQPHIILKCHLRSGDCEEVYRTACDSPLFDTYKCGGGAPAKLITWNQKDYFLGLAHISINESPVVRKTFFYAFDSEPPFQISYVGEPIDFSPEDHIEFATGLLIQNNETVIVSYGKNDCSCEMIYLNLDEIMTSLQKV